MNLHIGQAFQENFRFKITISIGLVLFLVLSLYLLFFVQQLTRTLNEGLLEQGENLATNLGFSAELGVLAGDPTFVDASIGGIFERSEVVAVAVYNKERKILSERGDLYVGQEFPAELAEELTNTKKVSQREIVLEGERHYEFFSPVIIRTTGVSGVGEVIGFTQVVVSLDDIREKQSRFIFFYFLVSIVIFFVAGTIAIYATRRITRSVDSLMHGVQNVTEGHFESRMKVGTKDEFGRLANAFNNMTDQLREGKEREESVSRMKSEFLSITAHQLRTPLSALKWVLHMSLEEDVGRLTKGQKELLKKGYDANERMITLVNDLLDVVRIEEGRFDYKFYKVDLIKLVKEMVADMRILAEQKKIKLTLHEPTKKIPDISLDSEKLRLAFMNIVDNAIQYTHKGGSIDIRVNYQEEVLIVVKDTGVGIPKHQLSRVFTKFFRADNAVRIQTSGSGLGLFIAKNIIQKHGGKIWIESEEGKGTTVYFTIPISHLKK